jgi:mono/diheme cytochrome c family protein
MSDRAPEGHDPAAKTPDEKTAAVERRYAAAPAVGKTMRTRRARSRSAGFLGALGNLVSAGLIIYLTYFFTMFFSKPRPSPTMAAERNAVELKAIEELRAEARKLLTTYGPGNAATKTVRIPIDRAMNLLVAESNQPASAQPAAPKVEVAKGAPPAATAPKATTASAAAPAAAATAPTPSGATAAAAPAPSASAPLPVASTPAPAHLALGPSLLYRAVCQACHDVDGKGAIGRKAMPVIPDFTDAKWQASRSDADLQHSMQEGKGQFMLPMKDKFALARTNSAEMLAFIRAFNSAGPAASPSPAPIAAASPGPAGSPAAVPAAVALAPTSAAAASSPQPVPPPAAALPSAPTSPRPVPSSALATTTVPPASSAATAAPSPAQVASTLAGSAPLPAAGTSSSGPGAAVPATTGVSPEKAAKLRVAGEFFQGNCVACHGPDGKGGPVRAAMPAIPDFTSPAWQTSHGNSQLSVSVLEGKGVLMPPWRGRVSPELAADLVAYVRNFGPPGLTFPESSLTQFASRFRQLRKQWDEIDKMTQMLTQP